MDNLPTPEPSPRGESLVWNSSQEAAVRNIGEFSRGFKVMHINTARSTSRMYEMLMITSIILGPAAGTIDVIGSVYPDNVNTFLLVSAVLSFLCGILLTIVKFAALEEESAAHKAAAVKYTSLESNVRRQLSLYRNNRPDPDKYLEWITTSYDELFASAPLLPRSVQDAYTAYAQDHDIMIPDQLESIEINTNYNEFKLLDVTNTKQIHVTARNSDVDIELGDASIDRSQPAEQAPSPDVSVKPELSGSVKTKRTKTMKPYADLGTFGDGLMKYEVQRMFGFDR